MVFRLNLTILLKQNHCCQDAARGTARLSICVYASAIDFVLKIKTISCWDMQGATKWCVCFRDVLQVLWCHAAMARTLTVSVRETHIENKASVTTSLSLCFLTLN